MSARLWVGCVVLGLVVGAAQADADSAPAGYSSAGLYNLANSYARAGKPGLAILNYERASLLAPGDPDVDANLRFVKASAHLPLETRSTLDRIARVGSPFLLSWIGILGIVLVGTAAVAARFSSRHRGLRVVAWLVGGSMIGSTACNAIALWPKLHAGVVLTASTPARVSPVPMGDSLFVLPEGETVRITAEHDGFTLVLTRTGRAGWVADSNVAPIVPRH